MKRIWLMLVALMFFLLAPAMAQDGEAGSAADNGAAEESAEPGAPEGGDEGVEGAEEPDAPGNGEDADATEDPVGGPNGDEAGQEEGAIAGGGAAAAKPWAFAAFDTDGDGFLAQSEFSSGLLTMVAGGAEGLRAEQFQQTVETFGLDPVETDFEAADANQDDVAGEQEFSSTVAKNVFQQWDADADNQLSPAEFSANMFATFDANADGIIDSGELEPYADWFGRDFEVAGGGEGGFEEDFFLGDLAGEDGEEIDAPGNGEDADATEDPADAPNGDEEDGESP
jgi:hypothetical protein